MRRLVLRMMLVVVVLFAFGLATVEAGPPLQQTQVQMTSPEMNAELRGVVEIKGSASVPNFQFYKVEFGVGPNPAQWAIIGVLHDKPVINSRLEVWDTTKLPDGVYTLRLQAVKRDGNYEEFFVRQVAIVNTRPAATLGPTATSILGPTPTQSPIVTPKATATLRIVGPTAALSMATATPTLSRPVKQEPLPLDPKSWGQAFCFGAAAMGVVFIMLGIVFGLRRLL